MASYKCDSSDSDSVKQTYASIVRGDSPLHNTWWIRFQEEDEEEAIALATKKSMDEQKGSDSDDVMCAGTPGFSEFDQHKKEDNFEGDDSDDVLCVGTLGFGKLEQHKKEDNFEHVNKIAISSDEGSSCFECSAVITGGDMALMDHLKEEHWSSEESSASSKDMEEKAFNKCTDCGKYFSAQSNLRKHKRLGRCMGASHKQKKEFHKERKGHQGKDNLEHPIDMSKRKLGPEIWENCKVQEVEALPYDIDGLCLYKLPYKEETMMQSSVDGRPWAIWKSSSRKTLNGTRRVAECGGTYKCANLACPYLKSYGHKNTVQFKKVAPEVVCSCCGYSAEPIECFARKIWEFPNGSNYVLVYHYGTHKCTAIKPALDVSNEMTKFFKENSSAKPSQCAYETLKTTLHETKDVEEVYKKAQGYADYKKIQNVKQRVVENINPLGHSFDAMATIKEAANKVDKFLIFSAEDGRLSGGENTFVFRSSREKVEMMYQMQRGGGGCLDEQYCFLDAEHDRVQKMKTINLSVEHPTLKELVTLASMDCQTESTLTLSEFWSQVNNALREYTGDQGYVFDPEGFVTDEHGGNRESIRRMLKPGAVERAKSCEMHFYDCGHKQERGNWSSGSKVSYRKMLHAIYHAPTPGAFEAGRRKLMDWADEKPSKRGHIKSWFNKFWFKRRVHVFRAFKSADTPNTNMAEAGHSRNSTGGAKNKSLATVAEEHIVECALLKSKLEMYENGTYRGGHCPTQRQKDTTTFRRQRDQAVQFAKELEAGDINPAFYSTSSYIDQSSSHRAPKRTVSDDVDALSETSSSETENTQPERRKTAKSSYRKRKRRSKVFEKSLSMAKRSKSIALTQIHDAGPTKKVYELLDSGRIRLVEISETPTCDCGMVSVKDISVHVIWVMLRKLNVNENDEILYQKSISTAQVKKLLKGETQTITSTRIPTPSRINPQLAAYPSTATTTSTGIPTTTTTSVANGSVQQRPCAATTSTGTPSGIHPQLAACPSSVANGSVQERPCTTKEYQHRDTVPSTGIPTPSVIYPQLAAFPSSSANGSVQERPCTTQEYQHRNTIPSTGIPTPSVIYTQLAAFPSSSANGSVQERPCTTQEYQHRNTIPSTGIPTPSVIYPQLAAFPSSSAGGSVQERLCTTQEYQQRNAIPSTGIPTPRCIHPQLAAFPPRVSTYGSYQKMPWHNSNPFVSVAINNRIKKCAGCPFEFMDSNGPPFTGLVVRHTEKDFYQDKNGQRMVGRESNRYYHCESGCLLNRHPYFSPALLRLDPAVHLNSVHVDYLQRAFNVQF